MDKYIICLANTEICGGRCLAGVEINCDTKGRLTPVYGDNGKPQWIRPVSTSTYGEVRNRVAKKIQLLSVVKLHKVKACPNNPYTENVYYSKLELCDYDFTINENFLKLISDNTSKTMFLTKGRVVPTEISKNIEHSSMLIHAENASAFVDEKRTNDKYRMAFAYNGTCYDFPITDPIFLNAFKQDPASYTHIPDVYLTISLGLALRNWHHKQVTGVIIPSAFFQKKVVGDVTHTEQPQPLPANADKKWLDKYGQELIRLLDKKNEIEEKIESCRSQIQEKMNSLRVKTIKSKQISVRFTPAKTVMRFDTQAFRAENEELYTNYCKPTKREACIVVRRLK
ncbi:MAG: hypothetical protein J6032_05515 [Bacteroidales bacterium]|nr:hypothetical protein [Bacteroidales bacterium]